jgi:hypothetical protein
MLNPVPAPLRNISHAPSTGVDNCSALKRLNRHLKEFEKVDSLDDLTEMHVEGDNLERNFWPPRMCHWSMALAS